MADADSMAAPVPNLVRDPTHEPGWLASFKTGLKAIASPRWAIAATALVVISISLPLLVSQSGKRRVPQNQQATLEESPPVADAAGSFRDESEESSTLSATRRASQQAAAVSKPAEREVAQLDTVTGYLSLKKADANETTPAAAGKQPAADASERKSEAGDLAGARKRAR
jgi:hypothetical protein